MYWFWDVSFGIKSQNVITKSFYIILNIYITIDICYSKTTLYFLKVWEKCQSSHLFFVDTFLLSLSLNYNYLHIYPHMYMYLHFHIGSILKGPVPSLCQMDVDVSYLLTDYFSNYFYTRHIQFLSTWPGIVLLKVYSVDWWWSANCYHIATLSAEIESKYLENHMALWPIFYVCFSTSLSLAQTDTIHSKLFYPASYLVPPIDCLIIGKT